MSLLKGIQQQCIRRGISWINDAKTGLFCSELKLPSQNKPVWAWLIHDIHTTPKHCWTPNYTIALCFPCYCVTYNNEHLFMFIKIRRNRCIILSRINVENIKTVRMIYDKLYRIFASNMSNQSNHSPKLWVIYTLGAHLL